MNSLRLNLWYHKAKLILIFFICFFVFLFPLFGDTLILKNKKVYRGRVITQSEANITFKTKEGQQITITKKEVLKVVYKDLNEQEAKKLIQEEEKKVQKTIPKEEAQENKLEETSPKHQKEPKLTPSTNKRTWFSIFWRSALIPGWGQLKAERYYSAGVAFLAFFGTAGSTASSIANLQNSESTYRSLSALTPAVTSAMALANNPTSSILIGTLYNQSIFSSYQHSTNQANNSITLLALVYGIQLVHSIYVGRQWEQEEISKEAQGWNFDFYVDNQKVFGRNTVVSINHTFRF